jgi:hypothetical protein
MDELKLYSLDQLIMRALREKLIDAIESRGDDVVIIQGSMRFVLNPLRAHAFLRGVIRGMSSEYRVRAGLGKVESDGISVSTAMDAGDLDSFRRQLLKKWWNRYDEAGSPFGRSTAGLKAWVKHGTCTTVN